MHFAEAIFSFAEAICSKIENNNHLSPVDTEAGTELGNKNINFFSGGGKISMFSHEVGSNFIRFCLVSILNLGST